MIEGKKILGVIAARGGSKGVPGKNIRLVGGKPLIAWTIESANSSKYLDRVILSSDDDEIITVAKEYGCDVPFKRDSELATDEATGIDVVLDVVNRYPDYDLIVYLQPTSPLRSAEDIDKAIETCIEFDAPSCVSVCETEQSPYWMYIQRGSRLEPLIDMPLIQRRQDLPVTYMLNGGIYVGKPNWLQVERSFISIETVSYVMPKNRSCDIDTEEDFELLEKNFKKAWEQ